jgi:tripartite-type tricarboxylate transporter receptor subunit TctC
MTDLMAGQVQVVFNPVPESMEFIRSGKLRALAVTSAARSPLLPDVATMIEAGVPGYEMTSWYAIFVPAATPRDIVSQLNAAVVSAVASPDLQERLRKLGSEPLSSSAEQMTQRLQKDAAVLTKIVKTAGITEEK